MRTALALSALLLLTGCSGDDPAPRAQPAPSASDDGRVTGVLDGVELLLEVADDEQERAVGLMRRTEVPAGTGMVFLYDEPSTGEFYMFDVPIPLRATFIRDGRVVSTVVMPPCPEPVPGDCPTYPADGPFDTVVETDPAVAPMPEPGDVFRLS